MNELLDLFKEMDDLFNGLDTNIKYPVTNFPKVKVTKSKLDGNLRLRFDLPRYSNDELDISFEKDFLILKGFPREEKEDKNIIVLADNSKKPTFNYKYLVPEKMFDRVKTTASFDKGILTINIPAKKQQEENKNFKVKIF